ncbi:MAG: hypothetical protein H0U26_07515 [Acidimicrobiia bacterium]|nr:hypothetical protein [Acidimicrobiia bacterium]
MTNHQVEFTEGELLEDDPFAEPLVAAGVRCHGGFDHDGTYRSPRMANRGRAIEAWQAGHAEQFATPLLDLPLDTWPGHYPNVAQAKLLIAEGFPGPVVSTLTRIGTVEGFGAMLRHSVVPDLQRCFAEDIRGTAMAHLDGGLYEAHARDEAGFEDEGGHKQMWFAARDVAFEHPVTEDETATMLARMGVGRPGANGTTYERLLPDDIDLDLELLIERMTRLLLIEISAFHTFAWAEAVLSDPDTVAGDGEAGRLVSYIRADETPHVAYLKTTLSEMRDRTFLGTSGRRYAGTDLVGRLWDRALGDSLGQRRTDGLAMALREVEHALDGNPRRADVLEGFHALGDIRPGPDRTWVTTTDAKATA